jgi:cell division protein FtsL
MDSKETSVVERQVHLATKALQLQKDLKEANAKIRYLEEEITEQRKQVWHYCLIWMNEC